MRKWQSENIRASITELEQSAAELAQKRDAAQAEAEEAYANADTAKATKAVKRAQDAANELETTVRTLKGLDERLVEASRRDNEDARAALEAEAVKAFKSARKELEKALQSLATTAQTHVPGHAEMMQRVRREVIQAAWHGYNADFSERYVAEVPAIVHAAPKRNADGARV